MLSDEVLELVSERLVNRIEDANTYILKQIGTNIEALGKLKYTDAYKLAQIMKYGGDYEKIIKKLSDITNLNEKEIAEIFNEVAQSEYEFAEQFYNYKKVPYIPYNENQALKEQIESVTSITQRNIRNMTNPGILGYGVIDSGTGKPVFKGLQQAYFDLIDEAVFSVGQGKETFNEAMSRQIKAMGGGGLKTIYNSTYINKDGEIVNRTRRLDSAVRMSLKDGLRTLHNETQERFGREFGADGVEISVHSNPAPDHEEMQGRQFSKKEYEKLQLEGIAKDYKGRLIDITHTSKKGKVSHRPVGQLNCYHYIFSIVLGVNDPEYTDKQLQEIIDKNNEGFEIDGKHYTNYEGTQLQRRLETEIRKAKDTQIMAKESEQLDTVRESQKRITELTNKYKELSNISGLPTKRDRLRVSGYKRQEVKYKVPTEEDITKMDRETIKLKKSLNKDIISSLSSYVGIGHDEINTTARLGKPNEKIIYNDVKTIEKEISNIDYALSKSKLKQDIITFRGTYEDFSIYNIGDTIPLDNFISTSVNKRIGIQFAKKKGPGGVLLEIRAPKGINAIYMGDNFSDQNEKELLLDRNLEYKLLKVLEEDDESYGKYKKYILEVLK